MNAVDHEAARASGTAAPVRNEVPGRAAAADCCGGRALFGWSPPALPADTPLKRRVDAVMPRSGVSFVIFFAVVVALLNVGAVLPGRLDLVAVGAASLAAGGWCAVNFWRCRHTHCAVTGPCVSSRVRPLARAARIGTGGALELARSTGRPCAWSTTLALSEPSLHGAVTGQLVVWPGWAPCSRSQVARRSRRVSGPGATSSGVPWAY
jgi:hypothetical protein